MNAGLGPLDSLFTDFFTSDFTWHRAYALLGEPADDQRHGYLVILKPTADSNIRSCELENNEDTGFLEGIRVDFQRPVGVDFAALSERFGPARQVPRLHPQQPVPHQFTMAGPDYWGYAMFSTRTSKPDGTEPVSGFIVRRFPPE